MATRTCVVCRGAEEKRRLVRFVTDTVESGKEPSERGEALTLKIDVRQRIEGRGAYLHARPKCFGNRNSDKMLKNSLLRQRSGQSADRKKGGGSKDVSENRSEMNRPFVFKSVGQLLEKAIEENRGMTGSKQGFLDELELLQTGLTGNSEQSKQRKNVGKIRL